MMRGSPSKPVRGLHPGPLLLAYLAVALAPLGLSWAMGLPPRPWRDELSSALAMVAFAMLLMEFVLSGRFRTASGRIGIDVTMRFHQLISWPILLFLLVHPVLYQSRLSTSANAPGTGGLGLTGLSLLTGGLALFLLLALVAVAALRERASDNYEAWRRMHGGGAIVVAVLGTHHALDAGRYAGHAVMAAYWLALLAVALASFAYVHLVTPLRQLRNPYRVASVRPVAAQTWEVAVEPVGGPALAFAAGQFVWLTLDRSPFAIMEHPFSISSCPADRPRIAFTIKEAGDFTGGIGRIAVGARAYLDGPHGNFTLAERDGTGIAFIAGGVGFAPTMSILRQLRADGDRRPMILLYGNSTQDQILFADELDAMQDSMNLAVRHVLWRPPPDWAGEAGQLDEAMLRRHLTMPDRDRWLYFVCGPTPMIDSVERTLRRLGVPLGQIVSEKFRYD